jgi:lipopolysaccharide/colanic/teichoic acid biosynthesis glycosyltransferase
MIVVREVPAVTIVPDAQIADALSSIATAFYSPGAFARPKRARNIADRALDLVLGSLILVCALPLLLALMALVRFTSQGSAMYKQVRVGRHGRLFACYKLRTMVVDADQRLAELLASRPDLALEFAANCKLRDDPRVTRVGRFLRRTSLDELPQLFNVLRGEMSLVGPRPLPPAELARYGTAITEVLGVRPGMTGPWQVSGRNDLMYEERIRLDLGFARHHSTLSNLSIIARTATQVIRPNGAY